VRAIVLIKQHDSEAALANLSYALHLHPTSSEAYALRGILHHHLNDHTTALDDLTRAIEIDPDHADTYRWRGRVYHTLRNYAAARDDYTRAIDDYNGTDPQGESHYERGKTHIKMGRYASAFKDFLHGFILRANTRRPD
jgi:tetratricopeptide (TPR) repeat protein